MRSQGQETEACVPFQQVQDGDQAPQQVSQQMGVQELATCPRLRRQDQGD
tara:strand:- start:96 stop:245 length:150 start_codon:yes stop_codon:yes gene_type:complete